MVNFALEIKEGNWKDHLAKLLDKTSAIVVFKIT
jgi:hypothetical protein